MTWIVVGDDGDFDATSGYTTGVNQCVGKWAAWGRSSFSECLMSCVCAEHTYVFRRFSASSPWPFSLHEIWAASVQHEHCREWAVWLPGFSPPAASQFTTYGQMVSTKTSDKSTTSALYFWTYHLLHQQLQMCVGAHTVHLQHLQWGA